METTGPTTFSQPRRLASGTFHLAESKDMSELSTLRSSGIPWASPVRTVLE